MIHKVTSQKGFTLVELMVSVAIFVLMTALLLAKYGSFNQGILLTNLAYDVALTLRTAQSYGLNVKSTPNGSQGFSSTFASSYGVHFDKTTGNNTKILMFVDADGNNAYNAGEEISTYTLKNGYFVSNLCVPSSTSPCNSTLNKVDVLYKRPDPDALIGGGFLTVAIILSSPDGTLKKIVVSRSGQIAVSN